MSSQYSFSAMPSVSISRSRFARKSQHKTTFNLGDIIPVYVDEVLPGDTRSIDMASVVRMSTPVAPIMDNIFVDFYAFFVPARLTWKHWKEFMGENNSGAGIPVGNYSIPTIGNSTSTNVIKPGSYGDYFGLPVNVASLSHKISALPFRGLALIYNRWFRNQNVIAPLAVQLGDTNEVLVGAGNNFAVNDAAILKAAKVADYFTKALPYAQKAAPVSIPLGTSANVVALRVSGTANVGDNILWGGNSLSASDPSRRATIIFNDGSDDTGSAHLMADLSSATAATINQLRYAFQLQKLLEKDALYGTRYWEVLAAHFGVTSPDASLQDPEYLGGQRMRVNIDQVLATAAGTDGSNASVLGQPGANSVSGFKGSIFTKSFTEHGYIYIVAVARHDQTYGQGINRMWSRSSRYDFYFPVFANLGAQEIKKQEIFAQGTSVDADNWGYQEAWAEYRYKPSIVTGLLRKNVTGNIGFWTLSNNFGSIPTLGQTFIEQDRGAIKDSLLTGNGGPDFIADFYFQDIAVRPMPMYSIPGLIDHH